MMIIITMNILTHQPLRADYRFLSTTTTTTTVIIIIIIIIIIMIIIIIIIIISELLWLKPWRKPIASGDECGATAAIWAVTASQAFIGVGKGEDMTSSCHAIGVVKRDNMGEGNDWGKCWDRPVRPGMSR